MSPAVKKRHIAVSVKLFISPKVSLLFLLCIGFVFSATAQWVKGFGGTRAEYGQAIAVDANGNVFVTGNFAGTADFDPGPGVFNLQSNCPCDVSNPPKSDIFLAKYNRDGNLVWAIGIGSGEADLGQAVSVDNAGNVYITGSFWNTADFDPGPGVHNLTSAGNYDIFLAKYDTDGNFLWANSYGSILADAGYGLKLDGAGNAFLVGSFFGTVDFDPGPGVASYNSNGNSDVFFAKYNASGGLIWAKDIEGTGEQNGRSIDVDQSGNIYVTGTFFGTSDFDPGPGTTTFTGAGSKDPFFAKYTPDGDFLWAKTIGSFGDEEAIKIAADASGNLYASGYFVGTVDFDPGPGTTSLTSPSGLFDGFLLKLNTAGDFQWVIRVGNNQDDNTLSVAVDRTGNPYICGYFQGTVDFDPGPATYNLTTPISSAYFAKYNAAGNLVFAQKEGNPSDEAAYGIAVDATGNIYVTGYFTGSSTFETGTGSVSLTSAGNADVFLLKFQPAVVLPVSLISFTGKKIDGRIVLEWSTSSESNQYGFDIERSTSNSVNDWTKIGFLPSQAVANRGSNYVFPDPAPTSGKNFYRLKQLDLDGHFTYSTVVLISDVVKASDVLYQNSPNPAKSTTRISYSLAEKSFVKIIIYTEFGQEIRVLQKGNKEAGYYEADFDCSRLQPGVYYYRLQTDKAAITKKMIVMR